MSEQFTKRLLSEEILRCFKVTGLTPAIGEMFGETHDGTKCACGIGVYYYYKGIRQSADEYNKPFWEIAESELGEEYVKGFYKGFDGINTALRFMDTERELLGFEDGLACRNAVILAGYQL